MEETKKTEYKFCLQLQETILVETGDKVKLVDKLFSEFSRINNNKIIQSLHRNKRSIHRKNC